MSLMTEKIFGFLEHEYAVYRDLPRKYRLLAASANLSFYVILLLLLFMVMVPFAGFPDSIFFYIGLGFLFVAGISETFIFYSEDKSAVGKSKLALIITTSAVGGAFIGVSLASKIDSVENIDMMLVMAQVAMAVVLFVIMMFSSRMIVKVMKFLSSEKLEKERDLAIGSEIQNFLLPTTHFEKRGTEVYGQTIVADQVGGDYFEIKELDKTRLALAIGDVSGKGVGAGLLMSMVKSAFLSEIKRGTDLATVLTQLNELIFEHSSRRMFVTFGAAVYDCSTGSIEIANAGHLPAYIYRKADNCIEEVNPGGIGLGLNRASTFEVATMRLEEGDMINWFTDGFTELLNKHVDESVYSIFSRQLTSWQSGQQNGKAPLNQLAEYLHHSVDSDQTEQRSRRFDDMTMLLLKRKNTVSNHVDKGA